MNKLLLTTLSLLACLSAFGQGTFNANNNYAGASILLPNGDKLSKATGRVEILGPDGSSLLTGGAAGKTLLLDGVFNQSNVAVPGSPLGSTFVPIVIRAWDAPNGETYATATVKNAVAVTVGNTGLPPAQGLGGGTTPAASLALNSTFVGLTLSSGIVPEPSTVALAAFGVAGLFFVARRKS